MNKIISRTNSPIQKIEMNEKSLPGIIGDQKESFQGGTHLELKSLKLSMSEESSISGGGSGSTIVRYVRIALQELEKELQIYEWRMQTNDKIVPITSCKIVSRGNVLSPYAIVKITMANPGQVLNSFLLSSLDKTSQLLNEILKAAKILAERFSFFSLMSEMIHISQENDCIHVWPQKDIWINPTNKFIIRSDISLQSCSEKQMVTSLIGLVEEKCLKTKLHEEFFQQIRTVQSFEELQEKINGFLQEKNLYLPQLKSSVQLSSAASSESSSLSFSQKHSRKKIVKAKKSHQSTQFRNFGLLNDFCHFGNNLTILNKKRTFEKKPAYHSQGYLPPDMSQKNLRPLSSEVQYRNSYSNESQIFSEFFEHETNRFHARVSLPSPKPSIFEIQTEKIPEQDSFQEMSIKIETSIIQKAQFSLSESRFIEDQQSIMDPEEIIKRNGWFQNLQLLNDNTPLKQSFCDGTEDKLLDNSIPELRLLKTVGREIDSSFFSVEQLKRSLN